ncbi:TonB-dependent receptor [Psychromonas sp. KJ10-10]|uniref:TonB-dependent receptor n=1 Tax=Psychromonas sp. KJ10-10 TaxID=3391823 RepID=UPI0039B5855E
MKLIDTNHCKVYFTVMLAISTQALQAEEAKQLEVMVVTAEKMDKNLKDTTTAITVIDGEEIAKTGAKTINDVITTAPNVVAASFGTVNIRGINSSGAATGAYATTSGSRQRINTTVDGVADAFTGYNFSGSGVWDVQQIEVLRGPQSSTQGENSIGGAVSVKTNDPTFIPEYAIRAGIETYENGNVMNNLALTASGPLSEDLAYRVVLEGTHGDDFVSYDGDTSSIPVDPEAAESLNLRGKLLWSPAFNEDLSIKLTTNYRKADGSYLNWVDYDNGEVSDDQTLTLDTRTNTRINDSDVKNIAAEINYDISNKLKSISLISTNSQTNTFDQYPNESTYTFKDETTSAESRLLFSPTDSQLTGFVGLMLADRENTVYSPTYTISGETQEQRVGLFGEGNYKLNEQFTLTLGGRLLYEEQDRTYSNRGISYIDDSIDDFLILPKLALTYAINPTTTLGLSARQGYNSGGIGYDSGYYSGTAEAYNFDSETVNAYEFSSKTAFNNGTTLNATLFFNDYQDYQATSSGRIYNVDGAYTYGLELEASHWLTDSLEIKPTLGLMQSKINSDTDYQGNELSNAPELNASLAFNQYIGENFMVGADATYVSEYYSDLENTKDYKAGDYTIFNTNLDYQINDLLISAYVTNLTNESVVYIINSGTRADHWPKSNIWS